MVLDAIVSLGSLLVPPIFNFINKKFLNNKKDNPITTMNTLAVTKPDVLASYIEAYAKYIEALVKYYNRDVVGNVLPWVGALRQCIRPLFVILSLILIGAELIMGRTLPPEIRYPMESSINSWFGSRLSK